MADNINVNVNVRGNAKKELRDITKEVKKTSTAFDVFKGVLGAQAFVGGIKAMARVAVNAFGSMIEQAKNLEQIETRFEVLTGSATVAKELLEELQQFAASTPFQLPGIADAAATLLAFGSTQDQVIDRLKVLGDVAAGANVPIKDLALIFGQVQAAGKLTGERFIQLAERGANVGPAIAKTMGIAESSVSDFISKGKVSFEVFETSMRSLTAEGGLFFNGMVKQSKTLGGVLSTLGDNFDLIAADIGQQFLPAIKEAAMVLIKFLQDNKENIKSFAASVSENMPAVITILDTLVRAFTFVFRVIENNVKKVTAGFRAIKAAAKGEFSEAADIIKGSLTSSIDGAAHAFDAFSEETLLSKMAVAVMSTSENFGTLTVAVDGTTASLGAANEAAVEFSEKQKEVFGELKKLSEKFAAEDLEASITGIQERAAIEQQMLDEALIKKQLKQEEFNALTIASEKRKNNALDKIEAKRRKEFEGNQKTFFSTAGKLQSAKSKELAAIGKAAAITQVAIDTPPAVSSSFKFGAAIGGPPVGFLFGAIAAAAQATQAAAIAGVPLKTGGEIPAGFPNDSFSARLTSGETVVPTDTTEDLKRFIAEQSGSKEVLSKILSVMSRLQNQTVVQIGNDTIIDVIRNAQDEGRVIA